jgi:glyoxylase-like metal-dependent hydrolase (beta-lactamase superfamily II)
MKRGLSLFSAALLLLLFSFASADRAAAQDGLTRIADNVYSYVGTKKASPANSFGANAGIIIGRDGIVVVDTLISAKEAARFIKDIRAVSDKPIRYVINTHSHLDHTFGNSEFAKLGAVIVSHVNGKRNMQINGEANLKKAGAYGLTEKDMEGTRITYPTLTFSEKMQIDLGDQVVELIYAGPSHTDDSISVYLADKKILFAGDILFTDYHPNIADGDLAGWTKTLDSIMTLDVAKIIPGHGPVSGKKDVGDMKDYLISFDKKARELAAVSNDVEYISAEIKKALPPREELDFLVPMNIQRKYLKK